MVRPSSNSSKKRRRLLQSEVVLQDAKADHQTSAIVTQSQQAQSVQQITPSDSTNLASAILLRTTVSSNEHVSYGTQSTPTKRRKLDDVFTPIRTLFDHADDASDDNHDDDSSYCCSVKSTSNGNNGEDDSGEDDGTESENDDMDREGGEDETDEYDSTSESSRWHNLYYKVVKLYLALFPNLPPKE